MTSGARSRIALLAAAIIMAAPISARAQESEARASFCIGAILEMMDYYRTHPENLLASSRAKQMIATMHKYERILNAAGLLNPPTWRTFDDVTASIERQHSGRDRRKACQSGNQDSCQVTEACLQ